jgi:hypothetical protein
MPAALELSANGIFEMEVHTIAGAKTVYATVVHIHDCRVLVDCSFDQNSILDRAPRLHHYHANETAERRMSACRALKRKREDAAHTQGVKASPHNGPPSNHSHGTSEGVYVITPEFESLNVKTIDAVVITHAANGLALPYLTCLEGFGASIFATEPTVETLRMLMYEVAAIEEGSATCTSLSLVPASNAKRAACLASSSAHWSELYTKTLVDSCMASIRPVRYCQDIALPSGLVLRAINSGHSIGSAAWMFRSGLCEVAYVGGASVAPPASSGATSLLTAVRHVDPLDEEQLKRADVVIVHDLSQSPLTPEAALSELSALALATVANGGNVILPVDPTPSTLEIVDAIATHFAANAMEKIPLYFVSSMGQDLFAHVSILCEWVAKARQQRLYNAQPPLNVAELVASGRLVPFSGLRPPFGEARKSPCVLICGHSSLCFGPAAEFVTMFGANATNLLLLTSPYIDSAKALRVYEPLAMRVAVCCVDQRMGARDASALLSRLQPRIVVHPDQPACVAGVGGAGGIGGSDEVLCTLPETILRRIGSLDCVAIDLLCPFDSFGLDADLAKSIEPKRLGSSWGARVIGEVRTWDGVSRLVALPSHLSYEAPSRTQLLCGRPVVVDIVEALLHCGVEGVKVDPEGTCWSISIETMRAKVVLSLAHAVIHVDEGVDSESHRQMLKSILVQHTLVI